MKVARKVRMAAAGCLFAALAACSDDSSEAPIGGESLLVRWATQEFCGAVHSVRLTLQSQDLKGAKGTTNLVRCSVGEIRYGSINAGTYQIRIEALEEDGAVIPIAETTGLTPDGAIDEPVPPPQLSDSLVFQVTVIAGQQTTLSLALTYARPGNDAGTGPDASNEDGGPTDQDDDGWLDTLDNCPTASNPGQEDEDSDSAGDVCDCAADDYGLNETLLSTEFEKEKGLFTMYGGTWSYTAGSLRQSSTSGTPIAASEVTSSAQALDVVVRFSNTAGTAPIDQRGAGILLRADDLGGSTSGYICGVDVNTATVFLARADAGDLSSGAVNVLDSEPVSFTIEVGSGLAPYRLYGRVSGSSLQCRFQEVGSAAWITVNASDALLGSGSSGAITFGAAADFGSLAICGN